jgi:hypothetical protein
LVIMRKIAGLMLVLGILAAVTGSATAGVIYSQAQGHVHTANWYLYGSYDGVSSQIVAQNFGPWHDGTIKEISVGGGFEIFAGNQKPNNLYFEIWEPEAPTRMPGTMLAQWKVPVNNLIIELDSDGVDLLTADVSAGQLELKKGYDYLLAVYSDGTSTKPLSWTVDATNGRGSFFRSQDNGVTWGPLWPNLGLWFGDPATGSPPASFEFEIRGEIECDENVIYDQTVHHVLAGGSVWMTSSYDSFSSGIVAQNWSPACPGEITAIAAGGEADVGAEPANLMFDIWELIAPTSTPQYILAEWTVPWGDLQDEADVEGEALKVADLSQAPLEVAAGVDYGISVYSDGDANTPWWWYVDMSYCETGYFWDSLDNGVTWNGPDAFGDPAAGIAGPALEFALRGNTGTVVLQKTPVGVWGIYDPGNADLPFFNPGWNWWSVPCAPAGDSDPASFNGFTFTLLRNHLYRWETLTTQLYPDDFTTVEAYRQYLLLLDNPIDEVSFDGRYPCCPTAEIKLTGGWNWFGVPFAVKQDKLMIRNDQTQEVRTVPQDVAMGANAWLNPNWAFYDSGAHTMRLVNYNGTVDDTMLRPWFGYRTMVMTLNPGESYTLIVPTQ